MSSKRRTRIDKQGRNLPLTRAEWGYTRQLPSGRWQASFKGPDGKRHNAPTTFPTKTDAGAWLSTQRAALTEGTWEVGTVTRKHDTQAARAETFGDYAARWIDERLNSKGAPLRESTKQGYRATLRSLDTLLPLPLTAITAQDVEKWYRQMYDAGKVTSASHGYALTRSIMATAVENGLVEKNPCKIKGANNARTGKATEPPTDTELAIITANAPEEYRALVTLAAWSALRFGEQTELRRGDLADDGEQILVKVRRGVTYIAGQGFVIGEPKTERSKRDVWLPPGASEVLRDHLAQYVGSEPDALLFPAKNGGHLKQSWHSRWWYPARAAAGRDDLPWHGLRHYGLTQYARNGATLAELMGRGGHTNLKTAMRYQDATSRDRELARRMEH